MIILFEDINENKKGEAAKNRSSTSPPFNKNQSGQSIPAPSRRLTSLRLQLRAFFKKDSPSCLEDMAIKE